MHQFSSKSEYIIFFLRNHIINHKSLFSLGDGRVFSTGFDTIDESQFSTNAPASLTIDCGWDGSVYLDRGSLSHMSYVQWFKVPLTV